MAKANGAVLWQGPSAIDGSPILLIATGLAKSSSNAKTGDLIQTWIIRADMTPQEAANAGADFAICGACPHRGRVVDGKNVARSCYVTLFHAPRNIHATWTRGVYPAFTAQEARETLAGRKVRLGAYGDPAAVPFDVWERFLADTRAVTGYTHQWRDCDPRFSRYCMASADSVQEAQEAKSMGYRCFRVGTVAEALVKGTGEVLCPASAEAGKKTDCAACLACGGNSSKARADIFIPAHGRGKRHVGELA